MGAVPAPRSDTPDQGERGPAASSGIGVLEGRSGPSWWERRWAALPRRWRRAVAAVVVLVLVAGGVVLARGWVAQRALRQQVLITTSLEVESSSTSPPGGRVEYDVAVRNDGAHPVRVTSLEASTDWLRLRMRDDGDRLVDAGGEVRIPVSVLLTCGPGAGRAADLRATDLRAEVRLRREDGGSTARRVDLRGAALVLDVAATLCRVRPGLRGYELSGPTVR